jgi:hypothetical protein
MDAFVERNGGFPDSFVKWCVMSNVPLDTCEDVYFRAVLDSIGKNVQHLGRAAVTAQLKEIAAFVAAHLPVVFEDEDVAVTMDGWTSKACEGYQCVTVHWIDSLWKLRSAVTSVQRFTGK